MIIDLLEDVEDSSKVIKELQAIKTTTGKEGGVKKFTDFYLVGTEWNHVLRKNFQTGNVFRLNWALLAVLRLFFLQQFCFLTMPSRVDLPFPHRGKKKSGFCATDDFKKKIKVFQDHIRGENVTNHAITSLQFDKILTFNKALTSDDTKSWVTSCDAEQKAKDANARINACTIEQKVCVDDGWGLSILCKTIKITLPSCLAALESNGVQVEQEEIAVESDADRDFLSQLDQGTAALMQQLFNQIDIAGSLYSIYVCIALFFPTPIVLFKPSIVVQAKQLLFGAGKYTFIATVLIIYWGYEHLGKLLWSPQVQIYLKNIVTDPCFLDSEFIGQRTAEVKETCADLIRMENKWGLIAVKINSISEVMDTCSEPFQCQVNPDVFPFAIGFTKEWKCTDSDDDDIWAPSEFLGNERICVDEQYSREKIFVAGETGRSFWELWMTSGLFASLLVKIAIANFGVALLKFADPFCICDGKYESPPEVMNQDLKEEEGQDATFLHVDNNVKKNKVKALKAIAFRECLIWGFFTNISLLSLIVASWSNLDEFKTLDYIVFAVIMGLSLGASFGCFFVTRYTGRIVDIKVAEDDTQPQS